MKPSKCRHSLLWCVVPNVYKCACVIVVCACVCACMRACVRVCVCVQACVHTVQCMYIVYTLLCFGFLKRDWTLKRITKCTHTCTLMYMNMHTVYKTVSITFFLLRPTLVAAGLIPRNSLHTMNLSAELGADMKGFTTQTWTDTHRACVLG